MKIAVVSDLHLDHYPEDVARRVLDRILDSLESEKPNLVAEAGDSMVGRVATEEQADRISSMPWFSVLGNHDFYGYFLRPDRREVEVGGVRVAGATLWTDLDRGRAFESVASYLNDFRFVLNLGRETWLQCHSGDVSFLLDKAPDVVVTHHAPSLGSRHMRFVGAGAVNYGFVSESLARTLRGSEWRPRLWVHGHVHDPFDYVEDGCRVVCNPMGYPGERFRDGEGYEPLYVEIES